MELRFYDGATCILHTASDMLPLPCTDLTLCVGEDDMTSFTVAQHHWWYHVDPATGDVVTSVDILLDRVAASVRVAQPLRYDDALDDGMLTNTSASRDDTVLSRPQAPRRPRRVARERRQERRP